MNRCPVYGTHNLPEVMHSLRTRIEDRVERASPTTLGAIGAIGALIPIGMMTWLPPIGDALMLSGALMATWAAGWAFRYRSWARSLPLQVSEKVLHEVRGDVSLYRFRARLGRGRMLAAPCAEVVFHSGVDEPVELVVHVPCDVVVGPWTFVVEGPSLPVADGHFELRVSGRSDGQVWRAQRRIPVSSVRDGVFKASFAQVRGRWVWDLEGWDASA